MKKQNRGKGRPQMYNFDMEVGQKRKFRNANPLSVRSAAWAWSQKKHSGQWKFSVTGNAVVVRIK